MTAACAALLLAPAAWAWDEPAEKNLGEVEARPGQTIRFQVEGTDKGATWTAWLEDEDAAGKDKPKDEADDPGRKLGSGEDDTDESGVEGEFELPDLGDKAREYDVVVEVEHEGEGGDWPLRMTLDYVPAAPKAAPEPAPATPQPPAGQPPRSSAGAQAPAILSPGFAQGTSAPADEQPEAGRSAGEPSSPLGDTRDTIREATADLRRALVAPRRKASPKLRRQARKQARRAKRRASNASRQSGPGGPEARRLPEPRDTRVDLSGDGFAGLGYSVAWKLLAAVALGGLLFALVLGAVARRRRLRREAEMEAALQEMVAEGRFADERVHAHH